MRAAEAPAWFSEGWALFAAESCSRAALGNACTCTERQRTACRGCVEVMFLQVLYFNPQHNQAEDKTGDYIDYFGYYSS